jgi:hypothetical protein
MFYTAFGLNIYSDLELPELLPATSGEDLAILEKEFIIPSKLYPSYIHRMGCEALFGMSKHALFLCWPTIATFKITNEAIVVHPKEKIKDIRIFNQYLLSETIGLALFLKGYFLLHASAVTSGDKAIIFAGPGGVGKSTTAGLLLKLGYKLIADDLVALKLNANKVIVYPSIPQLKLWPDSIDAINLDSSEFEPLYAGTPKKVLNKRKYFFNKELPLKSIYFLESGPFDLSEPKASTLILLLMKSFPLPNILLQQDYHSYFKNSIDLLKCKLSFNLHVPYNDNSMILSYFKPEKHGKSGKQASKKG